MALKHSINEYATAKERNFAKRLEFIVGGDDLGVVKSGEMIRYGEVKINAETCTLCLSCVGACNVSALVADKKTNSILFNPSVCTACGYCELSCAEKNTISLEVGKLALKPESFVYSELAHDELFACVECGKEFATKKGGREASAAIHASHVLATTEPRSSHFTAVPTARQRSWCKPN